MAGYRGLSRVMAGYRGRGTTNPATSNRPSNKQQTQQQATDPATSNRPSNKQQATSHKLKAKKGRICRCVGCSSLLPQQAKTGLAGDPGVAPQQAKTGLAGDPGVSFPSRKAGPPTRVSCQFPVPSSRFSVSGSRFLPALRDRDFVLRQAQGRLCGAQSVVCPTFVLSSQFLHTLFSAGHGG
jgi:hypothetical protein